MFAQGDLFGLVLSGVRALDLIYWLAGAFAFLLACELVYKTVVWVRGSPGRSSSPRHRRDAEVPPVATGHADNVGDLR